MKINTLTYDYRFKAAWTSDYEKEPVTEVFGEIDVLADSLVEMADKIIAASNK
jgi:2-haloacid dehalogenase